MRIIGLVAAVCVALAVVTDPGRADDAPKPAPEEKKPPRKLPTESEVMAAKLKYAQTLIEAVTREDFPKIEENATALVRISEGAEILNARKSEEYLLHAKMFRQTLAKMADKARDRNIEGVRLMYIEMSTNCFNCHDYTRKNKR